MDKVRKLLSPGTRKKAVVTKTFGVPLEDLVKRAPTGFKIPYIVKKICEYIENNGYDQEGIFRVNGSSRIIEKIRTAFDQTGDADLAEDGDVMAVAGVLKLFLRELPDSVIPEHMTKQFVVIHESLVQNINDYVKQVKQIVQELPEEHYDLLKYLIRFLVVVSQHEAENKMGPMVLSIVFGPNVFRCASDFSGLRDQSTTNNIVHKLILHYDELFVDDNEQQAKNSTGSNKQKSAPPRPPPPKLDDKKLMASPRKNKQQCDSENSLHIEQTGSNELGISQPSPGLVLLPSHGLISGYSPRLSDEDVPGRISPFALESDSGHSMVESPIVSSVATSIVEKTIREAIMEHVFGDYTGDGSSTTADGKADLVSHSPGLWLPDLRKKEGTTTDVASEHGKLSLEAEKDHMELSRVKRQKSKALRICDVQVGQGGDLNSPKPRRFLQHSTAANLKCAKGLKFTEPHPAARYATVESKDDGDANHPCFQATTHDERCMMRITRRHSDPLSSRPHNQKLWLDCSKSATAPEHRREEIQPVMLSGNQISSSSSEEEEDDSISKHQKSRIGFLDVHNNVHQDEDKGPSPERSPNNSRKPLVPPLDLSILHEHMDSADPILAKKGQSMSYQRAKKHFSSDDEDDDDPIVALSPRANKFRKKPNWTGDEAPLSPSALRPGFWSSVSTNTDIPPSPPVEQEQYRKYSNVPGEDEYTTRLKQLTKKIQSLRKKIKQFEETFEKEHGYRPSQSEKTAKGEIKKYMGDLAKARKELKKLKEEAEMGSRSRHGSGASSGGSDSPTIQPTMEQTLDSILKKLKEKRRESRRPEDVNLMTRDQVQEEKLAIQKSLLFFEGIHGRPSTKQAKDLMRPLYDRYRLVKRLLAKPSSPRDTMELQTVPEDQPFELTMSSVPGAPRQAWKSIRVPTGGGIEDEENDVDALEFAVTREFGLKDMLKASPESSGGQKVVQKIIEQEDSAGESMESMLHEMTVPQLQDELQKSRAEKKKLRKVLREFENDFLEQHGRKVQKEDKAPVQVEYQEYKQVKARLRLLEALLSKHQQQQCN